MTMTVIQFQPAGMRLAHLRTKFSKFLGQRKFPRHGGDRHAEIRRPPPFSLLLAVALATILLIAVISALQLLDAALG
ncbi:hypothetical protein JJB09_06455 [Rhizobium sp. KVB221]|uniref:Uncharacterized protein n=1 Tax=Rhizobium setariae TaxID=2801340 RepID=A0A937CNV6_9HYPH|nr:hypothetical protein [Rhizobium setariae]MBL0371663.1 hypothetical protein [Rhizobium setariae]